MSLIKYLWFTGAHLMVTSRPPPALENCPTKVLQRGFGSQSHL